MVTVADLLLDRRYGLSAAAPDRLHLAFTTALLDGRGLEGIWVSGGEAAPLADRVMEHAAIAVALERLRMLNTRADRAERLGQAAWRLAQGTADAAATAELRVPLGGRVELALGRARGPVGDIARRRIADRLTSRGLAASWSGDEILAVRTYAPDAAPPLAALLDHDSDPPMSWGVASPDEVEQLPGRLRSARALCRLADRIEGRGVATGQVAGALGTLATILSDDHAVAAAYATLGPVLEHDERTGRGLLHTLWSYVQHQRNTSSTARALSFNRHSLLYRLARIEEMTARSFSDPEDVFALEVAVRVMAVVDPVRVESATAKPQVDAQAR